MAEGARPQGKPQVAEAVGIPLVLHSQGHARHAPQMLTVGLLGPNCMYSLFQCTGATIFSYGCEVWFWHLRATFKVTQLLELVSLTNPVGPAERETHHAQLHCPARVWKMLACCARFEQHVCDPMRTATDNPLFCAMAFYGKAIVKHLRLPVCTWSTQPGSWQSHGLPGDFVLTFSYTGGHNASQAWSANGKQVQQVTLLQICFLWPRTSVAGPVPTSCKAAYCESPALDGIPLGSHPSPH